MAANGKVSRVLCLWFMRKKNHVTTSSVLPHRVVKHNGRKIFTHGMCAWTVCLR